MAIRPAARCASSPVKAADRSSSAAIWARIPPAISAGVAWRPNRTRTRDVPVLMWTVSLPVLMGTRPVMATPAAAAAATRRVSRMPATWLGVRRSTPSRKHSTWQASLKLAGVAGVAGVAGIRLTDLILVFILFDSIFTGELILADGWTIADASRSVYVFFSRVSLICTIVNARLVSVNKKKKNNLDRKSFESVKSGQEE